MERCICDQYNWLSNWLEGRNVSLTLWYILSLHMTNEDFLFLNHSMFINSSVLPLFFFNSKDISFSPFLDDGVEFCHVFITCFGFLFSFQTISVWRSENIHHLLIMRFLMDHSYNFCKIICSTSFHFCCLNFLHYLIPPTNLFPFLLMFLFIPNLCNRHEARRFSGLVACLVTERLSFQYQHVAASKHKGNECVMRSWSKICKHRNIIRLYVKHYG